VIAEYLEHLRFAAGKDCGQALRGARQPIVGVEDKRVVRPETL
jgi:hypothetical protein